MVAFVDATIALVIWLLDRFVNRLQWRNAVGVACAVGIGVGFFQYTGTRVNEARPSDSFPTATFRIVAMGDSYMAGEGARKFYSITDKKDNRCHQAPTAYAHLIATERSWGFSFLACSGAKASHVYDDQGAKAQYPRDKNGGPGSVAQVIQLREVPDPEIVLLSIGGNDSGFTELGTACATGECIDDADFFLDRLRYKVGPALAHTYEEAREAAEEAADDKAIYESALEGEVAVFAMTYPDPIGSDCAIVGMSKAEISWIRTQYVPALNATVRAAAEQAKIRWIDLSTALLGHGVCDDAKPAINVLTYGHGKDSAIDLVLDSPGALLSGTFHPNEYGHSLLKPVVEQAIDAYLNGGSPLAAKATALPADDEAPSEPIAEPAGSEAFPPGTQCLGTSIEGSILVPVDGGSSDIKLASLAPSSTVCYRSGATAWQSAPVDDEGTASVPATVTGQGAVKAEIIAQQADQKWVRVVLAVAPQVPIADTSESSNIVADGPDFMGRVKAPFWEGVGAAVLALLLALAFGFVYLNWPSGLEW